MGDEKQYKDLLADSLKSILLSRYEALRQENNFTKGQLVRWKKGLKNRTRPNEGEPAIVVDILSKPVYDESEKTAGSAYWREPLDIVLGILEKEGQDFILFHFDSRRFEPFE